MEQKKSLSFISLVTYFIVVINHPTHLPTPLLVLHSLTFQDSHLAIAFVPELVSQKKQVIRSNGCLI